MEAAAVAGTSEGSRKIYFSLRDVIQILFMGGLNTIILWEETFEKAKLGLLNQNSFISNLYFIFYNILENFYAEELSQTKVINEKEKILTIEELNFLFEAEMPNGQIDVKSIEYTIFKNFKEFILKYYKNSKNDDSISCIDIDSGSDNDDETDDEFEREFKCILKNKSEKKKKNTKFEQSFHLLSNDKKKYIKTPGEEGKHLIEIRVWDTQDIKNVPSEQWWTKINKKGRFLTSSSSDPLYISTNKILKSSLEKIKKTKGVTSGAFSAGSIKFKPY